MFKIHVYCLLVLLCLRVRKVTTMIHDACDKLGLQPQPRRGGSFGDTGPCNRANADAAALGVRRGGQAEGFDSRSLHGGSAAPPSVETMATSATGSEVPSPALLPNSDVQADNRRIQTFPHLAQNEEEGISSAAPTLV